MLQPELKVEIERVSDLVPYARNAKLHTEEQIEQIANSMEQFGNCDPIGVWTNSDGLPEIVEGHGRVLALQRLGVGTCPVIHLDFLTDEQRRAYALVHNQLTMNTGWDEATLASELTGLSVDFDFDDFGFILPDDNGDTPDSEDTGYDDVSIPSESMDDLVDKYGHFLYAYSGGRDSTLAMMMTARPLLASGKHVEALYVDNGCEFPDLIMHVKRTCAYAGVPLHVIHSEKSIITEYVDKGKFPNPIFMDCIDCLINHPLDMYAAETIPNQDYVLIRGGKPTQKTSRSGTNRIQHIDGKKHLTIFNPLYDYDGSLDDAHIPEWSGYAHGFDRTACWCCPFQRAPQWRALRECYPLLWDEMKTMVETVEFPRIDGDGHPRQMTEYWEDEIGTKVRFDR
jgi:3'-phosphoadenosine 5'-phosphosulfate sulfotransferase (PAPS reductase)/FAD synthetase